MTIDPGAITLVQTTFLQHIVTAFQIIARYAIHLLYLFAVLELTAFGLVWALKHNTEWADLFFKVLKIGLVLFIIQNYTYLIDIIMQSFAQLGGVVANVKNLQHIIFNPAIIWQYGYNNGLNLLQAAVSSTSLGLSLLQIILGLSILLVFGLLGIQIILQVIGFYLVSLTALIFLPFSVFSSSANMFDKSVQATLKAGARVMTLILVIGIAVTVWSKFQLIKPTASFNINQPLGLFFTALLFLYLAIYLPRIVADAIGQINLRFQGKNIIATPPQVIRESTSQVVATNQIESMQAATNIDSSANRGFGIMGSQAQQSLVSGTSVAPTGNYAQSANTDSIKSNKSNLADASMLEKSISDATLNKIKKTFLEALQENYNNDKKI